jgi:multicomponent Na+:H+ antiporter subunit D
VSPEHLPALAVVVPLAAAPLIVLLRQATLGALLAIAASLFSFGACLALYASVAQGGAISYAMGNWPPPWGIEYRIDALSAFVLVLVSAIGALVAPYAVRSIAAELPREQHYLYHAVFCLCLAGLLGMTATGDAFNLFVFMEVASLAMYVLIALGRDRRALLAAYQYLILGTIGATFYVIGVGLLYLLTGTLNIADLAARLPDAGAPRAVLAALAFITVGTSISSGGDGSDTNAGVQRVLQENPHIHFHTNQRGYVRCTVTSERWRADYRVLDYVTQPGSPIRTRSSWHVENGRPGAHRL